MARKAKKRSKSAVSKRTRVARKRLKHLNGLGQVSDVLRDNQDYVNDRFNNPVVYYYQVCGSTLENVGSAARTAFAEWVNNSDKPMTEFPTRQQFVLNPGAFIPNYDPLLPVHDNVVTAASGYSEVHAGAERCIPSKPRVKALAGLGIIPEQRLLSRQISRQAAAVPVKDSFELQLALAKRDVALAQADSTKCYRAFHSAADAVWEGTQIWMLGEEGERPNLRRDLQELDTNFRTACVTY
jgi:hypothetical protein